MYQAHWKLQGSPFVHGLDRTRFFGSPTHDEALARLHFLVEEHRRLGLLLGGAGSGKSLVQVVLAHEIAAKGIRVVQLNLLGVGEHEFQWQLAEGLEVFPDPGDSPYTLWRGIIDRLTQRRWQQLQTVVLLDDVDEAPAATLEQVERLAQLEAAAQGELTIILAAATHRLARLGRRLLALVDLRVDLEPWEASDTAQFIDECLKTCGRSEPLFTDDALRRIHQLSCGMPRRVCQLADLCLLAGAAQDLSQIDDGTVEVVSQELGIREVQAPERVA